MRYKDFVEDRVNELLSKRLKRIIDIFGQLLDILENFWIQIVMGEEEKAKKIIDNVPKVHSFENRYNNEVTNSD